MRTVSSQAFLRCALVVAVVGLGAYFGHSAFGLGGRACGTFFDVYVASGLSMFAAIVCFAGARTRRGDRPAWMLAAAGLGSWSVGDVIFHALYPATTRRSRRWPTSSTARCTPRWHW